MKATLEFDLPEESYEYRLHVHAAELAAALRETSEMLRSVDKHMDLENMTARELIIGIRNQFGDIAGPVLEATE